MNSEEVGGRINTNGLSDETIEAIDPYAPENIGVLHFVTQHRIYDVLMALLTEKNPELAQNVLEMHSKGLLIGPQPFFDGTFIANELDDAESEDLPPES